MNKGIDLATGDIIGIRNSDDVYVGKNVILTNWNGLKQHVKIVS